MTSTRHFIIKFYSSGYVWLAPVNEPSDPYQACSTYSRLLLPTELDELSMEIRRQFSVRLFIYPARSRFFQLNLRGCMRSCHCFLFCRLGSTFNFRSSLVIPIVLMSFTSSSTYSARLHT